MNVIEGFKDDAVVHYQCIISAQVGKMDKCRNNTLIITTVELLNFIIL